MEKRKLIAYIQIVFTAIVWGGSFVATKIAVGQVSPFTLLWIRFGIGVLILGITLAVQKEMSIPNWKDMGYFSLVGFIGITFHTWLQAVALKTTEANTTAWLIGLSPVFMALLGWIFLKERMPPIRWAGILIATLGVVPVASHGDLSSLTRGSFGSTGDWLIIASTLNWAVFSALSGYGLRKHPAMRMIFYVMGMGWVFITLILFLAGPGLSEIGNLRWDGWASIIFIGVFCSGIAYIFYYRCLKILPSSQVGAFLYLEPLVTSVVAASVLGEKMYALTWLGGIIIILGVYLVNRPLKDEKGKAPAPCTVEVEKP